MCRWKGHFPRSWLSLAFFHTSTSLPFRSFSSALCLPAFGPCPSLWSPYCLSFCERTHERCRQLLSLPNSAPSTFDQLSFSYFLPPLSLCLLCRFEFHRSPRGAVVFYLLLPVPAQHVSSYCLLPHLVCPALGSSSSAALLTVLLSCLSWPSLSKKSSVIKL